MSLPWSLNFAGLFLSTVAAILLLCFPMYAPAIATLNKTKVYAEPLILIFKDRRVPDWKLLLGRLGPIPFRSVLPRAPLRSSASFQFCKLLP
jgi:hypothetical protein